MKHWMFDIHNFLFSGNKPLQRFYSEAWYVSVIKINNYKNSFIHEYLKSIYTRRFPPGFVSWIEERTFNNVFYIFMNTIDFG